MELDDLIGPLPAPLGRWLLRRMVAGALRYGHTFAILRVRGAEPSTLASALRGADVFSQWDDGDHLALLPDTDRAGAHRAAERIRQETGALVGVAAWSGEPADDLIARATRAMAAPTNRAVSG